MFYTELGHRVDVWEKPWYQEHVLGGILWSLGLAKGSSELPKAK
jgi:type 1 glutamine amidotransferase